MLASTFARLDGVALIDAGGHNVTTSIRYKIVDPSDQKGLGLVKDGSGQEIIGKVEADMVLSWEFWLAVDHSNNEAVVEVLDGICISSGEMRWVFDTLNYKVFLMVINPERSLQQKEVDRFYIIPATEDGFYNIVYILHDEEDRFAVLDDNRLGKKGDDDDKQAFQFKLARSEK